ncbi:MAG: prepilin-type N-terminal cleavage/methylation domain-containing protein [Pirellulales bacterium]
MRINPRRRAGFTLVELVVVIMIIGILAAIAAPKIFSTSKTATDNAVRANLRVVRDAIDTYSANNGGALPTSASTLASQLSPYIRGGQLPNCPVGGSTTVNTATVNPGSGTQTSPPTPDGSSAYMYDSTYGWFIVNYSQTSSDGKTPYSSF